MEQGDDGALELGAPSGVDGSRGEGLPDDGLANVGGDEERYARTEAVAFLEQFVEQEDDQTGDKQLDYDQEADAGADLGRVTVHARHDVNNCLAHGYHHAEH